MIAFIWAQDQNGLIGKNEKLPWHLPNDLKFFKEKTQGNAIVMGRKTFEGMGKRPLPNRLNIILTGDAHYQAEGVEVFHSKAEVVKFAKTFDGTLYITGGASVYQQFIDVTDELYQTVIDAAFEGDTYFPKLDFNDWQLESEVQGVVDEKNKYPHVFKHYIRR